MTDTTPTPPAQPPLSPKDARAQAKAAKAYAKAQRPFYRKKRWWLAGALVVVVIIIASSAGNKSNTSTSKNNGVRTNSSNSSHPPQNDVTVTSCAFDSTINSLTAKLQIVNHSSKRSKDPAFGYRFVTDELHREGVNASERRVWPTLLTRTALAGVRETARALTQAWARPWSAFSYSTSSSTRLPIPRSASSSRVGASFGG